MRALVTAIPDENSWAVTECADADLGDARRTQRLVELATVFAQHPSASLPQACGHRAMLQAAYRFFDNEAIDPQAILASHVLATSDRLASVPRVLAVQDTTELDWTAHPAHQGLLVHTTLALTPERLPLGLLAQQVWARAAAALGKRATRQQRPLADKERQKWRTSVAAVIEAHARCPQTRFVCIGDREADVYDRFVQQRPSGVALVVRAAWNRRVDHAERYLWTKVAAQPVVATLTVRVPRRGRQPARQATMNVRWCLVLLGPPTHRHAEKLPTVAVWAVQALEEQPPAGCAPIAWRLLTTCGVHTAQDAVERVDWYACRGGIEVWHKVLKRGCRIEARQLESAAQLRRCLAIYSVIAWRILYATMLSRAMPEAPCTALLEPAAWQALYGAIHGTATPPAIPPPLRQAVHWLGRLGGFLGRRGDGQPGVTVLWRGFQHLTDRTFLYRIMRPPPGKPQHVGKD
jgi:hypothetical protein